MALIMNADFNTGLQLSNAYAKIDSISGGKDELYIYLKYYVSSEHYLQGKVYISQEDYAFTPSVETDSENFIKQGYEYLKKLPAFANAIDA